MLPTSADPTQKNVISRMRRWLTTIKNEISLKKALSWYFKAMIITYCAFPTRFPEGTDKSRIISALDRFNISPVVTSEVNRTYNEIYRVFNSCVTVIDHPISRYNKMVGTIDYFDEKTQSFAINFNPSIPDLPGVHFIQPGFLLSMNTKNYDEKKKVGARQRSSIAIKQGGITYTFDFFRALFESFRQYYDETRDIQDENVYHIFIKQTEKYQMADAAHKAKMDADEWSAFRDMKDSLHASKSLRGNDQSKVLFSLPLHNAERKTITDISRGLGVLDKSIISDFSDDTFNQYIKYFNCLIVGSESLSSLLPRQCVNDEVVNLISAW